MLFAVTLFSAQQAGQDTKRHAVKERDALAARRELSKGGIDIVNKCELDEERTNCDADRGNRAEVGR
jgi:hypothetical protein